MWAGEGRGLKAAGRHPAEDQQGHGGDGVGDGHACALHHPRCLFYLLRKDLRHWGKWVKSSLLGGALISSDVYLFGVSNFLVSAWIAR